MIPMLMLALLGQTAAPKTVEITPEIAAKLQDIAFQAAREGDLATLEAYFAAGQSPNNLNKRGDTLLIVSAYNGQAEAVKQILKQKGVAVDAKNKMGLTALTAAAFKGNVEIAKELVAAKANVNSANEGGKTALMFASLAGQTKTVVFLLGAGADPLAKDSSGNTSIGLARGQGAMEVVRLLEAAAKTKRLTGSKAD